MRTHFLNHRQISLALRHLPTEIAHRHNPAAGLSARSNRRFTQLERGLFTLEGGNDSNLSFVARMLQCVEDHQNTPRERQPR